jgi:hypothetical protein
MTSKTDQRGDGALWLRQCQVSAISPLGERVAELLDDLFGGIYHLEGAELVDWANDHHIEVRVAYKEWATFDSNLLTRLVFLAHDRCLRLSVSPRSHRALTLLFYPRQRGGRIDERHPTLEEAVAEHRAWYRADDPWDDTPHGEAPPWLTALQDEEPPRPRPPLLGVAGEAP